MTDETLLRLLNSTNREDIIIGANYLLVNKAKKEIISLFETYGTPSEDVDDKFLSNNHLGSSIDSIQNFSEVMYVKNEEVLLFLGRYIWLLNPNKYSLRSEYQNMTI